MAKKIEIPMQTTDLISVLQTRLHFIQALRNCVCGGSDVPILSRFAFRDFKTSAEFGDSLYARLGNVERSQTKT